MDISTGMRLYDSDRQRLYINAEERRRLLAASVRFLPVVRSLCLVLTYTGCRISEALRLQRQHFDLDAMVVSVPTLKRRSVFVMREVPIPENVMLEIASIHLFSRQSAIGHADYLWHENNGLPINRSTAYRHIKSVMLSAGIKGVHASPKGLRHGFGVQATRARIPLHMVQKWMGHSSMATTSIYATVAGPEERELANAMWLHGALDIDQKAFNSSQP